MVKRYAVQKTNDPWENLRRLRLLKKKTGCKYTIGLINDDEPAFYTAESDGCIHSAYRYHAADFTDILTGQMYGESGKIKGATDYNVKKYFACKWKNLDHNIYKVYQLVYSFDGWEEEDSLAYLCRMVVDIKTLKVQRTIPYPCGDSDYWEDTKKGITYDKDEVYTSKADALKAAVEWNTKATKRIQEAIGYCQQASKDVVKKTVKFQSQLLKEK